MPKRKYSDGDKAMALATLDANEGDVRKTAKLLNIPGSTLTDWSKNRGTNWEIAEIRAVKKQELSEKLEQVAHALVDNILIRAQSDLSVMVPLKDFAVTLGIAIDKMQILKGEPNQISRDVTNHTNEERVDRILKLVKPSTAA